MHLSLELGKIKWRNGGGVSGGMTGLSGGAEGEGPFQQRVIRTLKREHDHWHGREGKRTTASASERSKQQAQRRAGGRA